MNNDLHPIICDPVELLKKYDPDGRLDQYYQLLLQENQRVNLVSRETVKTGLIELRKLAAQSLLPLEKVVPAKIVNYLDIGSGGGFPAIPILLTHPAILSCRLVERTQKKAAALSRIVSGLDLNALVISDNFEDLSLKPIYDLVTLRLVKLTPKLLRRILTVLTPEGCLIYYSVPGFEIKATRAYAKVFHHTTSDGKSSGRFSLISKCQ
ncbi:MAG: RsmG family class I SAM-dependent methyltransferase [bacterium]